MMVFSDSDRVGRGEWSRVYDACMVVRVYLSGLRTSCMPRRCLRRLETRHPYHLGGVFWYGSSISIIIYLSLIRGISSVADGENPEYESTYELSRFWLTPAVAGRLGRRHCGDGALSPLHWCRGSHRRGLAATVRQCCALCRPYCSTTDPDIPNRLLQSRRQAAPTAGVLPERAAVPQLHHS